MSVNDVTFYANSRPTVLPRVLGILGQFFARYLAYRQRRADIATLHSMSERELKDIGVYRCDIDHIAHQIRSETLESALRARPGSTAL